MAECLAFASAFKKVFREANEEKKSLQLRALVQQLFFREHLSKKMIVRQLEVSPGFVGRWTRAPQADVNNDHRGWTKGRFRRWNDETIARIQTLHYYLQNDPQEFFTGATAIAQQWRRCYESEPPPLRTIGRLLAELGLSGHRRTVKAKGAARYLCYPEHTIYQQLPGRVLEADFIGRKFLSGGEPLNFIGFSFKQPPKLRYFQYVPGQTAQALMAQAERFFLRFEKPDYFKVDNCAATIGSGSSPRRLSRFVCFLLRLEIIPIFAVPRKPFSQASIEGNNSVFARKFWNRREFTSRADVCRQLEWFNQASLSYSGYLAPPTKTVDKKKPFVPQIYFIRQVAAGSGTRTGFINVLNQKIPLPRSYINYFVLAHWDLQHERLRIYFEKELKAKCIKELPFSVHENSRFDYC